MLYYINFVSNVGRTHRSNQINAPEYIFIISGLAGEQRFASTVAKRLENLGALTHGDRHATESRDFSRYNIDTKVRMVEYTSEACTCYVLVWKTSFRNIIEIFGGNC